MLYVHTLIALLVCFHSIQITISLSQKPITKVVVSGAGNSVGFLVFKKLLKKKSFYPIGLVKDKKGYKSLIKLGADPEQVKICDICNKESLKGIFEGATKAVLCESSKPKKSLSFNLRSFLRKITFRKQKTPSNTDYFYPKNQSPYDIDYHGNRNIIDTCVGSKVEHIVMLSSMGGYRGGSKQNDIGRKPDDDKKVGNVLKWKRAAERYLIKRSFFTIIHAGTLNDDPGGQREIVWDIDDALLRTDFKAIPKEDAAEVLVQALIWKEAIGRSIDIGSLAPSESRSEGGSTKEDLWLRFWARSGDCIYPDDTDV